MAPQQEEGESYRMFARLCYNLKNSSNNMRLVTEKEHVLHAIKMLIHTATYPDRMQNLPKPELYNSIDEFVARPLKDILTTAPGQEVIERYYTLIRGERSKAEDLLKEEKSYQADYQRAKEDLQEQREAIIYFNEKYPESALSLKRDLRYFDLRFQRMERDLLKLMK